MTPTTRWTRAAAIAALAIVGAACSALLGFSARNDDGASLAARLNDPRYVACQREGKTVCDPSAHATFVAGMPLAQPPRAGTTHIPRKRAVAMALAAAQGEYSSAAPPSSVVHARLLTQPEFESIERTAGHDFII